MYFSLRYYFRHQLSISKSIKSFIKSFLSVILTKMENSIWRSHLLKKKHFKILWLLNSNVDTTWAKSSALGKNNKHLVGDRAAALTFPLAAQLNLANFTN